MTELRKLTLYDADGNTVTTQNASITLIYE